MLRNTAKLLIVALGFAAQLGCYDVIDGKVRLEIARRTQCKRNMMVIGQAIAAYKGRTGNWPLSLEELGLESLPSCPSATIRDARFELSGKYVWNSSSYELSEDEKNHDANRLRLSNYSNAVNVVTFDRFDRPMVSTKTSK